jgi:hypothetical protein
MAVPVMIIDGDVVAVHSYWTDDLAAIVTDATVRTDDGREVVVNQLGGTVDGIGMIQWPSPPILELGMRVAVAAHTGLDLSQQEHVVLDSAKVLDYPPGFVRTGPTDSGHYLYWESGCAFLSVDSAGTSAIDGDGEFAVVDASIAEWNDKTAACSYFKVKNNGKLAGETKNDKINLIKFRDTPHFCANGMTSWGERPATKTTAASCYSTQAAAITTAVYINDKTSPRDGAIIDADIELNGVNFAISDKAKTNGTAGCLADLQNTLTHELGHFHGLEHPCRADGDPSRVDDQGNPVPSCFGVALPPKITEATMYNFQACGETIKQTLSDDDINAICKIYPTEADPGTCVPVPGTGTTGCCSGSVSRRPGASLLLAAATVLLVLRRRKVSRAA